MIQTLMPSATNSLELLQSRYQIRSFCKFDYGRRGVGWLRGIYPRGGKGRGGVWGMKGKSTKEYITGNLFGEEEVARCLTGVELQ